MEIPLEAARLADPKWKNLCKIVSRSERIDAVSALLSESSTVRREVVSEVSPVEKDVADQASAVDGCNRPKLDLMVEDETAELLLGRITAGTRNLRRIIACRADAVPRLAIPFPTIADDESIAVDDFCNCECFHRTPQLPSPMPTDLKFLKMLIFKSIKFFDSSKAKLKNKLQFISPSTTVYLSSVLRYLPKP
mgnify:CR=1 FL=1